MEESGPQPRNIPSMIDIHCHILPGADDGAADLEQSLEMGRIAVASGITTVVATPHVNSRFGLNCATIELAVAELNGSLAEAGIPLTVLGGAEVAVTRLLDMDDHTLGLLTLGSSPYLLVESPYLGNLGFLDAQLTDLQTRGFMPVLAHPERCPWFREDRSRLEELVEHGVLCQVTADALEEPFVRELRDAGLVHCVASDAHDTDGRAPGLQPSGLTIDAPAKLLAGELLSSDAWESAPCA